MKSPQICTSTNPKTTPRATHIDNYKEDIMNSIKSPSLRTAQGNTNIHHVHNVEILCRANTLIESAKSHCKIHIYKRGENEGKKKRKNEQVRAKCHSNRISPNLKKLQTLTDRMEIPTLYTENIFAVQEVNRGGNEGNKSNKSNSIKRMKPMNFVPIHTLTPHNKKSRKENEFKLPRGSVTPNISSKTTSTATTPILEGCDTTTYTNYMNTYDNTYTKTKPNCENKQNIRKDARKKEVINTTTNTMNTTNRTNTMNTINKRLDSGLSYGRKGRMNGRNRAFVLPERETDSSLLVFEKSRGADTLTCESGGWSGIFKEEEYLYKHSNSQTRKSDIDPTNTINTSFGGIDANTQQYPNNHTYDCRVNSTNKYLDTSTHRDLAHSTLSAINPTSLIDNNNSYLYENHKSSTNEPSILTLHNILKSLGLSQYIQLFNSQGFQLADFLLLTREDLIELGLPISARNRILAFQNYLKSKKQNNFSTKFMINKILSEYYGGLMDGENISVDLEYGGDKKKKNPALCIGSPKGGLLVTGENNTQNAGFDRTLSTIMGENISTNLSPKEEKSFMSLAKEIEIPPGGRKRGLNRQNIDIGYQREYTHTGSKSQTPSFSANKQSSNFVVDSRGSMTERHKKNSYLQKIIEEGEEGSINKVLGYEGSIIKEEENTPKENCSPNVFTHFSLTGKGEGLEYDLRGEHKREDQSVNDRVNVNANNVNNVNNTNNANNANVSENRLESAVQEILMELEDLTEKGCERGYPYSDISVSQQSKLCLQSKEGGDSIINEMRDFETEYNKLRRGEGEKQPSNPITRGDRKGSGVLRPLLFSRRGSTYSTRSPYPISPCISDTELISPTLSYDPNASNYPPLSNTCTSNPTAYDIYPSPLQPNIPPNITNISNKPNNVSHIYLIILFRI